MKFLLIINLLLLFNNFYGIKVIKLWKISKICREIFNKIKPLNEELSEKIKYSFGYNLKQNDINYFDYTLSKFNSYNNTLYKGIYDDNELFNKLKLERAVKTDKYYSFSKNKEKAIENGEKIILILNTFRNFDISRYSKDEVIIDKFLKLQIIKEEKIDNFVYIYLIELKN